MAEPSSQTPVTSVKTPGAINTLLRSLLRGTPYRTPDRRRFGPVGEKQSFRVGVYGQLTISPALVTQRQPTRQKITNAAEISKQSKGVNTQACLSGKNVWKMKFFPGQGKVREFCGWPGKFRKDLESLGKVGDFENKCGSYGSL